MRRAVYRIIDANLNRSREGLRVCEDIARFALNSTAMSRRLKSARHAISRSGRELSPASKALCAARDSAGDVGRKGSIASEMSRRDLADIFIANMERAKESVRVLEEFSKLYDEKAASAFTRTRFTLYEIEKEVFKRIASLRHIR
jgi:thiamine-phosphate pyrophosphorylase